jgi:hypothetical protein
MKVINCQRELFYQVSNNAFDALNIMPIAVELGVFKGNNANQILNLIKPKLLYLLDTWSTADFLKAYSPFDEIPLWMDPPSAQYSYYGGDALSKEHWDSLYEEVIQKFKNNLNVKIKRGSSEELYSFISSTVKKQQLDFIYIDASHQYEYIFRDLMLYSKIGSENSIIQINDCCHSERGVKQNLGVLEAVTRFIKMSDWRPVAINTTDFSDLLLAKKNSGINEKLNQVFFESANLNYVEVPYQILGNSKILINNSNKTILSFD